VNFKDILEKWEQGTKASGKNAMETWLSNNKVYDKDAALETTQNPGEKRRRLLRSNPDDILDIHGLTSEKAWISLDCFFSNAKENGFEKVRIIHGKGNHSKGDSVLGSTVRNFIEKCPFAGESGHEKSANGGTGATWVLLKN
jgi:DNA-nicking Smr family endonuclease